MFCWHGEVDQISTILWKSSPGAIQTVTGSKRITNAGSEKRVHVHTYLTAKNAVFDIFGRDLVLSSPLDCVRRVFQTKISLRSPFFIVQFTR
jgi:hypothetical protein